MFADEKKERITVLTYQNSNLKLGLIFISLLVGVLRPSPNAFRQTMGSESPDRPHGEDGHSSCTLYPNNGGRKDTTGARKDAKTAAATLSER